MGCAGSKQSKCRHCQASPYSPMSRRSFSMNVHHPPEKRGDSYHVVALTSSTLGSIKLDEAKNSIWDEFDQNDEEEEVDANEHQKPKNYQVGVDKTAEFTMGMIEAKAWSKMIDEKITRVAPRTPIRTPPGEPETINVEELMEGLEESSPLRLPEHVRSFSFHVSADSIPPLVDSPRAGGGGGGGGGVKDDGLVSPKKTKTIWFDSQEKEESNCEFLLKALVSEFDPEVISAFRKALEELSPTNPFYLKPRDGSLALEVTKERLISSDDVAQEKKMSGFGHVNGFVDRIVIEEEKENLAPSENGDGSSDGSVEEEEEDGSVVEHEYECEDYSKERVILYFTSLRGVRKTHEDCSYVRVILKGLGVRVDERDVSMHSGFRDELKELLSEGVKGGLPKVFVGEKYIGGVDEIRRLHEDGKLEKVVEGCEMMDDDGGNLIDVCDACGDVRFVPCETCSGSCKIYYECEEHDEEYEEDEYGFQRCPDCNENGLVRCPLCCY